MKDFPETIRVFLRRRMLCVGCPVAVIHTVDDVAVAHGIEPADLGAEIEAVAAATDQARGRRRPAAGGGGRGR
jgi:hybrid cluster-associated redox disulfide protein